MTLLVYIVNLRFKDSNSMDASITLESVIDVGQGISVGPGKFDKKNKRWPLNKHRAWKICQKK